MIKLGIIGSGFGLYGLLPAFHSVKNCQVVAICGKKTPRLLNYCQSIGLTSLYTDWQEMLQKEELDAVAIAAVPNAQYTIAKVAIKNHLNIFAEKPLAVNITQANELLALAKKEKIVHMVDFIFPEIAEWQQVKKLLESQRLGKLKHISVDWMFLSYDLKHKLSTWKTELQQGGGALSFFFSHVLYYLEYFAGEITDVKSKVVFSSESLNGGDVGVDLLLQFKKNISGTAHLRCDSHGVNKHQLIFECERGMIVLENTTDVTQGFTVTVFTDKKVKHIPKKDQAIYTEDERVLVVQKLAKRFIQGCLKKEQVTPSFKEGARVQELIEQVTNSQI